ncbi:MAG: hypothetical protein V1928_02185 [Parcubacteria group bacterium]
MGWILIIIALVIFFIAELIVAYAQNNVPQWVVGTLIVLSCCFGAAGLMFFIDGIQPSRFDMVPTQLWFK